MRLMYQTLKNGKRKLKKVYWLKNAKILIQTFTIEIV